MTAEQGFGSPSDFFMRLWQVVDADTTLAGLHAVMVQVPGLRYDQERAEAQIRAINEFWNWYPLFLPIRLAELFDEVVVPHDEQYLQAMIAGLSARSVPGMHLLFLREDEEFREELFWRLFEIEGTQLACLANQDRHHRKEDSWQASVLQAEQEGLLDRPRLLRSCLEALNRDFAAFRAGWFQRLHDSLKPTVQELADNQELLNRCLTTSVTATVSMAVKHLAALHRADLLEPAGFLAVAAGGFSGGKASALAVLRMLRELAGAGHEVVGIVEQALGHSHVDVQEEAEKLLRELGAGEVAAPAAPRNDPTCSRSLFEPQLIEAEPMTPVTDEDAVLRISALLEAGRDFEGDAIEAELCLAWLAAAPEPATVLAALQKRVQQVRHSMAEVIIWAFKPHLRITRPRAIADFSAGVPGMSEKLWERRLAEVKRILAGKEPRRPLLATPTHSDGSISGDAFQARVAETMQALGLKDAAGLWQRCPDDLTQASFRLTDEDRARVAAELGMQLPDPSRSVVVTWVREESGRKANGKPEMVWWKPAVHPTGSEVPRRRGHADDCTAWDVAVFSHLDPGGAAYLVTDGLPRMYWAVHESSHRQAEAILDVLESYRGQWSAEAAQLLALGLSSLRAETRARAAEVLASCVPARLPVELAAEGFAACVAGCKVNRWVSSLTDAATLNPGMVADLLTALLPRLDQGLRGIGGLRKLL
ncbi:MAG: DUF6493 family protein [Propionibacteriaceae bacterium]|nr:DUF6493 family protein [Propionibacteriaceae bacterium]